MGWQGTLAERESVRDRNSSTAPLSLAILMAGLMLATNIAVQWQLKIGPVVVTYGLFIYPLTFLVTDYTSEIFGKRASTRLVWIGFFASLPPSLLLSTLQICIGSLLAYLVAQLHDVWAFHWLKRKTRGRFLWLRNNASTMVSQLIDTALFATVAFYGVLDNKTILSIILSEYPLKLAYAAFDTVPLYMLVRRRERKMTLYETSSAEVQLAKDG